MSDDADARAADALRGAVAADPHLPADEERFAAEAERIAASIGASDAHRRQLVDRLLAMRSQLAQAGS